MKTEMEILKMGDEILTEDKKNPNHITTQLNRDEGIGYNTGFHTGFVKGYNEAIKQASKNLVKADVIKSVCPKCKGSGWVKSIIHEGDEERCPLCNGQTVL